MPFDPAPRQPQIGIYQRYADALLKGCQMRPEKCVGAYFGPNSACALGAMVLGLGFDPTDEEREGDIESAAERAVPDSVYKAYFARYGNSINDDNDDGLTREEIAARIAAL